ncbi:hypothetical protein TELCIR_01782 [Teladorsagia circumcincta]|uniref:Uncharacterized protein n=1 Tax=Teladorsagia circumcincta TaxID=45464 RepID=A0A2G9V2H6_TELCI|nr:hypothetical protein TELCIR_01782 [Teladorsagia circumcincta]
MSPRYTYAVVFIASLLVLQYVAAQSDDMYELQRVARAPKFIRFGRGGGAKFIRFGRGGTNTWLLTGGLLDRVEGGLALDVIQALMAIMTNEIQQKCLADLLEIGDTDDDTSDDIGYAHQDDKRAAKFIRFG